MRIQGNANAGGGSPARETAWTSALLVVSFIRSLVDQPALALVHVPVQRDR